MLRIEIDRLPTVSFVDGAIVATGVGSARIVSRRLLQIKWSLQFLQVFSSFSTEINCFSPVFIGVDVTVAGRGFSTGTLSCTIFRIEKLLETFLDPANPGWIFAYLGFYLPFGECEIGGVKWNICKCQVYFLSRRFFLGPTCPTSNHPCRDSFGV